jgi:dTDP-4-dehydrorhamnose reductase
VKAREAGIDLQAITPWSLLGSYDWNSLLTRENLHYEPGAFDVSGNGLRPTALTRIIKSLALNGKIEHPLLIQHGWWHRQDRFLKDEAISISDNITPSGKPLLVIGRSGTLANAFSIITGIRSIPVVCLSRNDVNIFDCQSVADAVDKYQPWGVVNCAGYVNVDMAETEPEKCMQINATAPAVIASVCRAKGIPFMTFSSDLVFGGDKSIPYTEKDEVNPLNIYGHSKALAEEQVLKEYGQTLVIRSSAFFGPWDKFNFVYAVLRSLENSKKLELPSDVIVSPTYVPDLVNASLDLFIDEANGIWHVTNNGSLSWADFAEEVARQGVFDEGNIIRKNGHEMNWPAQRPVNSALKSEKGIGLPTLDNAIERYFRDVVNV